MFRLRAYCASLTRSSFVTRLLSRSVQLVLALLVALVGHVTGLQQVREPAPQFRCAALRWATALDGTVQCSVRASVPRSSLRNRTLYSRLRKQRESLERSVLSAAGSLVTREGGRTMKYLQFSHAVNSESPVPAFVCTVI